MSQMNEILKKEFGQLDFDREVRNAWEAMSHPAIDLVAEQLGATPPKVASAVCRLQSRGFIFQQRQRLSRIYGGGQR